MVEGEKKTGGGVGEIFRMYYTQQSFVRNQDGFYYSHPPTIYAYIVSFVIVPTCLFSG